ncbi:ATPase synthesis protein 25 mitochondrial [Trapelia coarctata]|nr:ATPase synthesis protein 25 mitochondrial [Trapelia coarctata]
MPRSFSTSRARRVEVLQKSEEEEVPHESTAAEASADALEDPTDIPQSTNESIPWYLQVQPPPVAQSPLLDRQRLPELPDDPPPLLQPILEHLSIQVGLDNLVLLDVRKLDPPPALGANLLMLIGTARSEKHLHVSADRFSRWLRTTHKLHPYADGLLGRNELKIKLRRKARRAKLLGSVGSSESGINADDGIRTGWVCVNVGSIEEASNAEREETASQLTEEDFVGFREESDGVKLVVQMLTEEKREELDLESLWGGFLARQQRKEAREAEKLLEEIRAHEVGHSPLSFRQSVTDSTLLTVHSLPTKTTLPSTSRGFHSSARLRNTEQFEGNLLLKYDGSVPQRIEPKPSLRQLTGERNTENPVRTESSRGLGEVLELEADMQYLNSLLKGDAIRALGQGAHDRDSTLFLTTFYLHLPPFPSSDHWQYRFGLLCYAFNLGHPGYTKADIFNAIQEMQSSAIDIPPRVFEDALRILAGPDNTSQSTTNDSPNLSLQDMTRVMGILTDMELRNLDISDESTLSRLVETLAKRVISLLDRRQIYLSHPRTHYVVLSALASRADWSGFWRYWRGIARRMQRKPFIIYVLMFRALARKGHQAECVHALGEWIPEMDLEEPPVLLRGVLAEAVMEMLSVVEPDVQKIVECGQFEVG